MSRPRLPSARALATLAALGAALFAIAACGSSDAAARPVPPQTIGGTVEGLAGAGLVLREQGGETLAVRADGPFTFPTRLAAGSRYAVTVEAQPVAPWQICQVTSGAGTVADAPVSGVTVTCTTNRYAVGGTVSGLAGAGLVLADASGGRIAVAPGATTFSLPTPVESGAPFAIAIEAQPVSPWQTCQVTSGRGTIAGAAVADAAVTCTTNRYTVGGTVSGLAGAGLVLADAAGGRIAVAPGATTFSLPAPVASGVAFAVAVEAQPVSPWQTCQVTPGQGRIADAAVADVAVTCTTNRYAVGGTISGLVGGGLVLADAGAGQVTVPAGATSFQLPAALPSGAAYAVAVQAQPTSPWQTCEVASGRAGTVGAAEVGAVAVRCTTDTRSVAGTCTVGGQPEAGLTVVLSGATSARAVTDPAGSFVFPAVAQGRYTLTTASDGVTFAPASLQVVVGGADLTRQDFAGTFPASTLAWDQGRWSRGSWE